MSVANNNSSEAPYECHSDRSNVEIAASLHLSDKTVRNLEVSARRRSCVHAIRGSTGVEGNARRMVAQPRLKSGETPTSIEAKPDPA